MQKQVHAAKLWTRQNTIKEVGRGETEREQEKEKGIGRKWDREQEGERNYTKERSKPEKNVTKKNRMGCGDKDWMKERKTEKERKEEW